MMCRWKVVAPLVALGGAVLASGTPRLTYPETKTVDVVDEIHGKKVRDPYRWLEDDVRTSADVRAWVEAENKVSFGYLAAIPSREAIERRLTTLWNYERYSSPFVKAGKYYHFKNDGLQNQSVFYVSDSLDGAPRVLLDPNTWSTDGTVALAGLSFSDDGRYLAYARSGAGSDWQEWFVRDLATGQDLDDRVQWTKFTNAAWTPDGRGFFYARFDAPAEGEAFKALNTNQKVFYHRAGSAQADDVLVYERPDQPRWGFSSTVSEDGRYLILSSYVGTDPRNRVFYRDLLEPYGMPVPLIDTIDNEYTFLGNDGPLFYFKTDLGAPRGRVVAIDTREARPVQLRELIGESKDALQDVSLVGNVFVATYLKDAATRVRVFRIDGTPLREVELPGMGSAGGFGGRRSDVETFYSFSSFHIPPTIYHYDLITGESKVWRKPKVDFDPEQYTVEQVFYKSKDGTRVPMFLTHKKGMPRDGAQPTLLYGYGGFSISLTPVVLGDVRRHGWSWGACWPWPTCAAAASTARTGTAPAELGNKQNVFDDFIAAAEWLIENKVTRTSRQARDPGRQQRRPARRGLPGAAAGSVRRGPARGGRDGHAALPEVHRRALLGRRLRQRRRTRTQFTTLYAYSPYHNLKPGVRYPATLITTADTDDRVVPGHSFKFAAALQHAQAGDAPVLIRIETRAGHGGGKPTAKVIEETADEWAFLVHVLGVEATAVR